jgi:hypothetical protein
MMNRRLFEYYKSMEALGSSQGWAAVAYLDNCEPYEKDLYAGLILNRQRERLAQQGQ